MADEMLDIVNETDIVIGQQARSIVHQEGLWHRGVHVFLFSPEGKLLVQKRSADRSSSPSMLDCSVSEHVKAGENYLDAAIRGLKEELGLEGRIQLKRFHKFRMNYGPNDNEISELYEGVVDPKVIRFDPVEIDSIYYFEMVELSNMLNKKDSNLCGWFIELLKLYSNDTGQMQLMD